MQHKRKTPYKAIALGVILLGLAGGAVFLLTTPIPAPQQPIEKELDAAALLQPGQP